MLDSDRSQHITEGWSWADQVPGPPIDCRPDLLGTDRFSAEFWVLSHPSPVVHDVLPLRDLRGEPILYVWAHLYLPAPGSWAPEPARFPRPGLTASIFFNANPDWSYVDEFMCSATSYRARQYTAVEAAAGGSGGGGAGWAGGLHCAWLELTAATLAPMRDHPAVREFLLDAVPYRQRDCPPIAGVDAGGG